MSFIDEIIKLKEERDNFEKALAAVCISKLDIETPLVYCVDNVRIWKNRIDICFKYMKDIHTDFEFKIVEIPYSPRYLIEEVN